MNLVPELITPLFIQNIGLPGLLLLFVVGAIIVVPYYQLWKRTGHNGWISLLMIVPLLNVIMLFVLAFKSWPILEDRK